MTRAEGALAAARDRATATEWALHNGVLDSKTQVAAQYGKDSEQLQSPGLKRESGYRRPPGRKAAATKRAGPRGEGVRHAGGPGLAGARPPAGEGGPGGAPVLR